MSSFEKYDFLRPTSDSMNYSTFTQASSFVDDSSIYDRLFCKDRTKMIVKKSKSISENSKATIPFDFKKFQVNGSFRLKNIIENKIIDNDTVRIDEFGNLFVIEENNDQLNILDTLNSSNESPRGSSSLESNSSSSTNSIEPIISHLLPRPPPLPPLPQNFTRSITSNLSPISSASNIQPTTSLNLVFPNPNQYEYDYNVVNKQDDSSFARSSNGEFSSQQHITLNRNSQQVTSFRSYTNLDENCVIISDERVQESDESRIVANNLNKFITNNDDENKNIFKNTSINSSINFIEKISDTTSSTKSKSSLSSNEASQGLFYDNSVNIREYNNNDMVVFRNSNPTQHQDYESIRDLETDKRRFSKSRIIDELIQTEMDYFKVIKLVYDVYYSSQKNYNFEDFKIESIFCNLKEIVDLSNIILNDFEQNILNKPLDQARVGICFLKNSNLIRKIYAYYAQYIECSIYMVDKNEKVYGLQNFIDNGLKIIKEQTTSAFDLHSLLLKPIQRVLKYPLLLQELLKNTEQYHIDYNDLKSALCSMQEVASYINEIKRRRDMIFKYGRKDREHKSISEKFAKISFHSVVKKSNRIGMKLSNVFKLSEISTIDKKFNVLEAKFRYFEKLIKVFNRETIGYLHSLKEFFKSQTMIAESIQEYYAENQLDELKFYVQINALSLNSIYNANVNFVHENVLRPLNILLKYLEIPNKLITKRHDKLLDFECARSNIEKLKDNKHLIKTFQAKLHESQRNFEALNNQLIEELPILINKCSELFSKCFWLYLKGIEAIKTSIHIQLENFLNQSSIFGLTKEGKYQTIYTLTNDNPVAKSYLNLKNNFCQDKQTKKYKQSSIQKTASLMSNTNKSQETQQKQTSSFRKPLFQKIKQFTTGAIQTGEKQNLQSIPPPSTAPNTEISTDSTENIKVTNSVQKKLIETYKPENLFKVVEKYSGKGANGDLNLDLGEIVGVIKKSDPSGNSSNWLIDNGSVKGIVPSSIFKNLDQIVDTSIDSDTSNTSSSISNAQITSDIQVKSNINTIEETNNVQENVDINNKSSSEIFIQDVILKNPVTKRITLKKEYECCIALYNFESFNETTLSIEEGEKLKILQKHDDNLNNEWWLVEKCDDRRYYLPRGYVPSNYVEILDNSTIA